MKKLRQYAKYVFLAAFCGVIGLSFVVYNLFSTRFSTDKHENRLRTQLPQTLQSDVRQLPQALNLFMEDNAPFRFQLTWLNAELDYKIFGTSQSENVLPGKEGWFFYKESTAARPLANYQGLPETFDSAEALAQASAKLQILNDRLAENGCTLVLDLTPEKNRVYREYIPAGYPIVNEENRTDRLAEYLRAHTTVPVNWQYPTLRSRARLEPEKLLYYKADTHWNAYGALLSLDGILEQLNLPTLAPDEYRVEENGTITGDMSYASGLYNSIPQETCCTVAGYESLFTQDPRAVRVFGDSFGQEYLPYLTSRFAVASWAEMDTFTEQTLEEPACSVLILEVNERNLDKLLELLEEF